MLHSNLLQAIFLALVMSKRVQAASLPIDKNLVSREISSTCGPSTFNTLTTSKLPLAADCLALTGYLRSVGSAVVHFDPTTIGQRRKLVVHESCAFGYQSEEGFYIAGDDVADLVGDSVAKFEEAGRIGSQGEMECDKLGSDGKDAVVKWSVFHSLETESLLTWDMVDSLSIFDLPNPAKNRKG